jgi:hypothetical protein
MEVKGQLHVPDTLRQGKELTASTEHGVGHFEEKENFLRPQGIEIRFLNYLVLAALQKNINYIVADVRA